MRVGTLEERNSIQQKRVNAYKEALKSELSIKAAKQKAAAKCKVNIRTIERALKRFPPTLKRFPPTL